MTATYDGVTGINGLLRYFSDTSRKSGDVAQGSQLRFSVSPQSDETSLCSTWMLNMGNASIFGFIADIGIYRSNLDSVKKSIESIN